MMSNRHERRRAAKQNSRVLKFIINGIEMTFTPATIDRVVDGWLADNPGKSERDMPSSEFADRCMKALIDGARPLPIGTA